MFSVQDRFPTLSTIMSIRKKYQRTQTLMFSRERPWVSVPAIRAGPGESFGTGSQQTRAVCLTFSVNLGVAANFMGLPLTVWWGSNRADVVKGCLYRGA